MTVFWHHVGDQLSTRDFPKTIGKSNVGLRKFGIYDIEHYVDFESPQDRKLWLDDRSSIGSSKFQVWGLPSGARTALKKLKKRDTLLLLNSQEEFGFFEYIGRVLCRIPAEQWRLSQHLWGESKFPIILLLAGQLIEYPFSEFKSDFHYGVGLKGMGRVHPIGTKALSDSKFGSESALLESFANR